jgi:osmotically-inducible protein OsmY
MTTQLATVTEETPLDEVVHLMEKRRIKRVPVVHGQQTVGMVSRANLLHALASISREVKSAAHGDKAVRKQLMAELDKQSWAPLGVINVTVRDGVVELWGCITEERQRQALVVAAENMPGVKGVRDHLVWLNTASED